MVSGDMLPVITSCRPLDNCWQLSANCYWATASWC